MDNYINSIYKDSKNRFWVGSFSGGLFQFLPEQGKFIKYNPIEFQSSEFKTDIRVLKIFEDHNHNLLLGTESNGIIQFDFDNKEFKPHPKNKSFVKNMIVGFMEDDVGNLWISSSRGLIRYSPITDNVDNFSHSDGLVSSGFNRNAIHKTNDGKMYFGSNGGLTHFYPLEVSNNPYIPQIAITDFRILNKSQWSNFLLPFQTVFNTKNVIELRKKDYFFTIEFAALDYTTSKENQYKYKLEGFDEDWIETIDNRIATYTNLNPGTYTFKVTGSNNDKVWNEIPTELQIKVIPPFYKTYWFYILTTVLIVLAILLYIRLRTKNLIRDKNNLEIKVAKRTTEISLQKEELKTQAESLEIINQKLEDHQERLENLVHERTNDLEIAKEKAEESDRLKSAFLANMSHEIRTPMNAIIGFSDLIVSEEIEKEYREELSVLIQENSYSLLNLIDDIIDIAKIDSEQFDLNYRPCSVDEIFKDVLYEFKDLSKLNDKLSININDAHLNNSLEIETDPFRLKQILKNLLSNAVKFTEVGNIEFGYNLDHIDTKKKLYFFVKDEGIGLTPKQQGQIFSRFTKIEDNKTKLYRGAGLGLAITKKIIELMGGEIIVESEINKGSTFSFFIPYKPIKIEKEVNQKRTELSSLDWSNKTILITEDEESNFKYLRMIIKKTKASVLWARTGEEAIEIFKKNKNIDLILMDIQIPEINGLEVTRKLKKEYPNIPIIAQTAYAMENDENISLEAGCDSYLSKPIKARHLLETLSSFLH